MQRRHTKAAQHSLIHVPSTVGWSGTGSEESVPRWSSSSTAASGPSVIARSMPTCCHSSATCVGVAPSASSAAGLAPARSSASATAVRPSCAAYLRVKMVVAEVVEEVVVWMEEEVGLSNGRGGGSKGAMVGSGHERRRAMLISEVDVRTPCEEQLYRARDAAHRRRHQHRHLAAARGARINRAAAREPLGHRFG